MEAKTKTILTSFLSLIWLMSLFIGFSFVNDLRLTANEDLVYCPLQKIWVKRAEESQPVRHISLDQICMSDRTRQELAIQIALKKAFAIDENGIFEALQKGTAVLAKYRENPSLPQQNLTKVQYSSSVLNTSNNWKISFIAKSEAFSFALNSRPPTVYKTTKFDFQFTKTLDQISRNINPRSPPFSI